ncbi:glutaredoxin domain-containing protein [Gordonia alkanivorans]|uniref:glutaredoxin domain-containing protein n=1 Tax=Gordonia alkanivorans TaxID=84096 RepID=UPI003CC56B19
MTVYTKPACVQCYAAYRALDKEGLTYRVIDISADDAARDYVMALGLPEGDPFDGPVAMRLEVGGSWSTVGRTRRG